MVPGFFPASLHAMLFAVLLSRALVPSDSMPGSDAWMQHSRFNGMPPVFNDGAASAHDRGFGEHALWGAWIPESNGAIHARYWADPQVHVRAPPHY